MKRSLTLLFAIAASGLRPAAARSAQELSLGEALRAAETNSPQLRAAGFQEEAARKGVAVARAGYFPTLDLQGVDTWGFPGSSRYLGAGGLMGSPYRSGVSGGVSAQQTLFDFGRTRAQVLEASNVERLRQEDTQVERYGVGQDVLQTFYQCARFRSDQEAWTRLHDETKVVAQEVSRFVDTGQRSVVDRYLAQAQVEEARTNLEYFRSRAASTAGRLGLLMGRPAAEINCPSLPPIEESVPLSSGTVNPYIARSKIEVETAQDRLFAAKAEYLPKILGVASAGAMERTRLVDRTDYSGGLAVALPLFDGFGTYHRVGQAQAQLEATRQHFGAVQLEMDELNRKYDEVIDASRARIEHLEHERRLAENGFAVAKRRYFRFQGTLIDLREALRNLGRIEVDLRDTQADLLQAAGAKALLNGGAAR